MFQILWFYFFKIKKVEDKVLILTQLEHFRIAQFAQKGLFQSRPELDSK